MKIARGVGAGILAFVATFLAIVFVGYGTTDYTGDIGTLSLLICLIAGIGAFLYFGSGREEK